MKIKPNYLVIPLLTILTAIVGAIFSSNSIRNGWYDTVVKPPWTPTGATISFVWSSIFILAAISAIVVYNSTKKGLHRRLLMWLFVANALLNIFWSFIFFFLHFIGFAALEAMILWVSVLVLIIKFWKKHTLAAFLLFPYISWVTFATYLTFALWKLN